MSLYEAIFQGNFFELISFDLTVENSKMQV